MGSNASTMVAPLDDNYTTMQTTAIAPSLHATDIPQYSFSSHTTPSKLHVNLIHITH